MAKFGTFLSFANPASGGFIYGDKFSAKAYAFYYRNKDLIKRAAYAFLDDTGYKTKSIPVKYARDLYYQQEVGGEVTFKEYYKLLSNEISVLKGYSDNLHGTTKNPIEHWIVDEDTNRIYLTLKTADRSKAETIASDLNKKAKRERYIVRGFGVENPANSHSEILNDYELEHDVKLPKSLKTKIGKIMERETNAQRKSGLDLMALKAFPSSHIQKAIIEVRKTVLK